MIALQLIAKGADVNAQSKLGQSALMHASWEGHMDTVKYLLAHGANVNLKDIDGKTAINAAILSHHEDIAEVLKKSAGK